MQRLPVELDRLYATPAGTDAGLVRAMVFEVLQPVAWDALSEVWHGVQVELELPAPAIAVSGTDGLQLWFSLEAPLPAGAAHDFLEALRLRFLPHVAPARVRLWPDPARPEPGPMRVPTLFTDTGNWSAFVAPDLAPLFTDTPWLDIEPGDEGQATLLRSLQSIKPAAFDAARAAMRASAPHALAPAPTPAHAPAPAPAPAREAAAPSQASDDEPRRFLLRVMNDDSVEMALRIEAAKALLR